jgi:hypothetical protein
MWAAVKNDVETGRGRLWLQYIGQGPYAKSTEGSEAVGLRYKVVWPGTLMLCNPTPTAHSVTPSLSFGVARQSNSCCCKWV